MQRCKRMYKLRGRAAMQHLPQTMNDPEGLACFTSLYFFCCLSCLKLYSNLFESSYILTYTLYIRICTYQNIVDPLILHSHCQLFFY